MPVTNSLVYTPALIMAQEELFGAYRQISLLSHNRPSTIPCNTIFFSWSVKIFFLSNSRLNHIMMHVEVMLHGLDLIQFNSLLKKPSNSYNSLPKIQSFWYHLIRRERFYTEEQLNFIPTSPEVLSGSALK